MRAGVRVEELIGDESENGSAAGGAGADVRRGAHFWIPILPAGFWKRWVCAGCGRDPHVTTKTRRGFKCGGFVVLVLFSVVFWVVPFEPDSVAGFLGFGGWGPPGGGPYPFGLL